MRRTLALGAIWCWSSVAAAQQGSDAEVLFNKGVDAMEAGNLGEACPALLESQRLDPRPGTLFTLAECESRWGRQASAFEHFQDYLRQVEALPAVQKNKHSARQQKASEAVARLAPRVAQVTLVGAPAGSEVFLDGRRVTAELLQAPAAVEPGEHWALVRSAGA